MQENHSFDSYFGALAYAPGSPYHQAAGGAGCSDSDHRCVDGFHCTNANPDDNGRMAHAFHNSSRCVKPGLDHTWAKTHREVNFDQPNTTRQGAPTVGMAAPPANDCTPTK